MNVKLIFFIILFISNISFASEYLIGIKDTQPMRKSAMVDGKHIIDNIYLKNIDNVTEFLENNDILFIEPNFKVKSHITPNDKFYEGSWWFDNISGINAEKGWDSIFDASSVTIAVLDTGISPHPDLVQNLLSGVNFVSNNFDATDDNNHGTYVAGVIGAVGNNDIGIAGVAWRVKILPIKVLDSNGDGYVSDIIRGIDYAISQGADIINASYGRIATSNMVLESIAEYSAIKKATDAGIIFVASSGNEHVDTDIVQSYPANYENVISVGATDNSSKVTGFTNVGRTTVAIYAPGEAILSTSSKFINGGNVLDSYKKVSGTSISAPMVSGALALLKAKNPHITPAIAKQALINSGRDASGIKILNIEKLLAYDLNKLFLPPYNLASEIDDSEKVVLTWESYGGATQIFARRTPFENFVIISMVNAGDTSFKDNSSYGNYKVRSIDNGIYTSFSNETSTIKYVPAPAKKSSNGGCSMSYSNDWLLALLILSAFLRLIFAKNKLITFRKLK